MNEASLWRFGLARRIGAAYAINPKVRAVMVAGSTGRGTADRFSDLEIDIYWSEPPTEDDRSVAVARASCELLGLDEDADEWEEQMNCGGFHAATSAFLVSTMERYLCEALEDHNTSPSAQMRLYSLLHSVSLYGADQTNKWVARARQYPHGLTLAMLKENMEFDGFGYAEYMYAARDDLLMLYDIFVRVERQILGALLGLNRIYLPNPGFKSMDEVIAEMGVRPNDLAVRLKRAFRVPPAEGVAELHALIEEVFALVGAAAPEIDLTPFRAQVAQRRGVWDAPLLGLDR